MRTQLLIYNESYSEWFNVDLFDDVSIPITFNVSDIKNLSEKKTSFSSSFDIPCSTNNMKLIYNIDLGISQSSDEIFLSKKYPCKVLKDGQEVFNGTIVVDTVNLSKNKPLSYTVSITSNVASFFDAIRDKTFKDINWSDIAVDSSDMSPYNIVNHWYGHTTQSDGVGIALIDRVNSYGTPVDYWRSSNLSPYVYLNTTLDKIITEAGYKWESKFFQHQYDGTWDKFNDFIEDSSGVMNLVSNFDTSKIVIPSQIMPNNFAWDSVVPAATPVSTVIERTATSGDDQLWVTKCDGIAVSDRVYLLAQSANFFASGGQSYKEEETQANGNITDTTSLTNYVFTADAPGWYEISFNFDWKFWCDTFRKYGDSTTLLEPGQKLRIANEDAKAYDIKFDLQIVNTSNVVRRTYNMYSNQATAGGVRYKTGGTKVITLSNEYSDARGGFTIAESTDFEEHNTEGENIISLGANGYTWGRPVKYSNMIYLFAGEKVRLNSEANWYNAWYDDEDSQWYSNFYKLVLASSIGYYSWFNRLVVSSRIGEEFFSAKLVDKIGPYRTLDPSSWFVDTISQTDFISGICKMFNLYIEDVSNKAIVSDDLDDVYPEKVLRIEPYNVYYNTGMNKYLSTVEDGKYAKKVFDFNEYVDFSTTSFNRPNDYLYRNILVNQQNDNNDYYSKIYSDFIHKGFDEFIKRSFYSSDEDNTIIEPLFSKTMCGSAKNINEKGATLPIPIISSLKESGELNEFYTSELRLLNLSNIQSSVASSIAPKVYYDYTNYVQYPMPLLSNFSYFTTIAGTPAKVKLDGGNLEFGLREYYLEFPSKQYNTMTNNDLWNVFYSEAYNQITSEDARILYCKCYIPENIISNLKLSDIILINNTYFYINKISSWTSEFEPCSCEFIKIVNESFYPTDIETPHKSVTPM